MSLVVSDAGGSFETCPAGTHQAVCIKVVYIGTRNGPYGDKKELMVQWELPDELMSDGRPFGVSAFYTPSLNEKANLRRDLEAWRGRKFTDEELAGFHLKNILGKNCMISVIHNEKGKAKVESVMALPKSMQPKQPTNDLIMFDVDSWDDIAFHKLPEGFQKLIKESLEYKSRDNAGLVQDSSDFNDDIPF